MPKYKVGDILKYSFTGIHEPLFIVESSTETQYVIKKVFSGSGAPVYFTIDHLALDKEITIVLDIVKTESNKYNRDLEKLLKE